MKSAKHHPSFLAVLAFCCLSQAVAAPRMPGGAAPQPCATESETQGGVTWSFSLGKNGAIVTGADPAAGALTVPPALGGQPVVEIGYTAFASCDELTSVAVPAGVENIGERAFQYCSLLEEVSLPAGVTNIGAMAFQYCDSLSSLALPQSVVDIGTNALFHCGALAKLYAPWAWWNTTKTATAGVGADCTVIYGEPGKVTLIFVANGGTCDTPGRGYAPGEPYGWLPEASRESYFFAGWWTEMDGGTRVRTTDLAASLEGWQPLYARWVPLTQEVTFDPNGGTCDTTNRVYNAGESYSPLPTATREHYDFAGWWADSWDDSGTQITDETLVTTNATRTLYAHWTLVEQVITFDPNGGECDVGGRVYAVGGKYSPLPKATREGCSFDGWFTAAKGGDRLSAASAVTVEEHRTLYAHWTLVEQIVTFNSNSGTCGTTSRAYAVGENYGWLPEATRADGSSFSGWYALTTNGWVCVVEADVVTVERSRELWAAWGGGGEDVPVHVSGFTCDGETGGFSMEFTGTAGKTYALQRARQLEGAASWATVETLDADRSGTLSMAAKMPSGWDKGVYRVLEAGNGSGLSEPSYLVVDLSAGSWDGATYPVSYLLREPEGGWTAEYKTTKLVLRRIESGTFTMGSPVGELGREESYYSDPERQHEVTISKPFYMGVFEVTQMQWVLVMGSNPSSYQGSMRPVECVSYNNIRGSSAGSQWPQSAEVDATSFMGRIRARTGGFAFDLPTEAQWEYACRGGTMTALNSGKDLTGTDSCPNMAEVGRYYYNKSDGKGGYSQHTMVGSYRPNAWGLYDMHGNVWEWCLDWWQSDLWAATDPVGAMFGLDRVLRGGSWGYYGGMRYCRSAYRGSNSPSDYSDDYGYGLGFRLSMILPE